MTPTTPPPGQALTAETDTRACYDEHQPGCDCAVPEETVARSKPPHLDRLASQSTAPTPPEPVASALAEGEPAGEPFMFAYENVDKPGEWRAFRQQIKRHDGSICPGRALYTHLPLVTAEAAAARIASLSADVDRLKLAICGGEDVPGTINMVTVEDCERFCREGHALHGDSIDRATQAKARADRLAKALEQASIAREMLAAGSDRSLVLSVLDEALREPKSGGGL